MSLFKKDNDTDSGSRGSSAKNTIAGVFNSIKGINRTDGVTPISLIGRGGNREKPGFTPNESYNTLFDNNWFGQLLDSHPDYSGKKKSNKDLSTEDRFNLSKDFPKVENEPYSTRDWHLIFNDTSMDYFKHGLQVIDGKNSQLRSEKNARETWDGYESGVPSALSQVLGDTDGTKGTPYENTDPVMFGFEVIVDLINSPLLNGSVEDFIASFPFVNEIATRRKVMNDFRQQFIKIFKTKGTFRIGPDVPTASIKTSNYANTDNGSKMFSSGKPAYMSYYLKKIQGLEKLIEANLPDKNKALVEYRKDTLKLTFTEDVSLDMGTLAYLYKLLYWSKPSGKNIVPENLLRFNCDIVISEMRHFNRVRKGITNGDLEVVKDNLSRYVYTLNECQFWFDQPGHESEVDLSNPKTFDDFVVTLDYKYATTKFERWTPDGAGFGKYVSYNNAAMWKVGNPGARTVIGASASVEGFSDEKDIAVPRFYSNRGGNTLKQNGVGSAIVMESYNPSFTINESVEKPVVGSASSSKKSGDETEEGDAMDEKKALRKKKRKEGFDAFKERSSKAGKALGSKLKTTLQNEVKAQVNTRLRLLNNTLDKLRNEGGLGRMRAPTNVYSSHPAHAGMDRESNLPNYIGGGVIGGGAIAAGVSPTAFFDVQNSLRDFAGDALGGKIGGLIRGGNNPLF
jgi:hypothetical protein